VRGVAVALADGAVVGAPVLPIRVVEGVAAMDAVEVKIPTKGHVFVQLSVRDSHQHGEGRNVRNLPPFGDERAGVADMRVQAGLRGRRETSQGSGGVDSQVDRDPVSPHRRKGQHAVAAKNGAHEDVAGEQADGSASRHGAARLNHDSRRSGLLGGDSE
jgi:hypothetical protein